MRRVSQWHNLVNPMRHARYFKDAPSIKVRLDCTGEWIWEGDHRLHFTNIEEDIQGRDIVTFQCPLCKEEHQSMRVRR